MHSNYYSHVANFCGLIEKGGVGWPTSSLIRDVLINNNNLKHTANLSLTQCCQVL